MFYCAVRGGGGAGGKQKKKIEFVKWFGFGILQRVSGHNQLKE